MSTAVLDRIGGTAPISPADVGIGADPQYWANGNDSAWYDGPQDMLAEKMECLVKGYGYARPGGNTPLTDDQAIFKRAMRANVAFKNAIKKGIKEPDKVYKGLSPQFAGQFRMFAQAPQNQGLAQLAAQVDAIVGEVGAAVGKNFTTTSPLTSGFVPFDLAAPSRLVYPVYTPLRNKLPRVPGQGASARRKVVTGISGSQTGSSGGKFVRLGIPELVSGSGNLNNWPLNLPPSGSQDAVDINVPYRFWGLSESLSWLAQFEGQGFEDISALANLILLQEFMLNEEAAIIAATSITLSTPSSPVGTARSANTGEVALNNNSNAYLYVTYTAATWYGETAAATPIAVSVSSGQVVDVAITPIEGAMFYNIYGLGGSSSSATALTGSNYYLLAGGVGGVTYTLQGAVPTSGTVHAPIADTGTYSAYDQEGLISVLSGHSTQGGASAVYPSGWSGGYVNQAVGDTLNLNVLNTAFWKLWDGPGNGLGAYRASPAEIIAEGGDVMRLSNDIVNSGTATNYHLFVEQTEVPGVTVGTAVSQFVNPVSRAIVKIVVHPWLTQGTAMLMSYTLPNSWTNVANCWEMTMVQDYLSVAWPVIDASFRFSMFMNGAMVANAPFYSGILQGLQVSDRSGSTGTWS